jgi:adenylate cyclase
MWKIVKNLLRKSPPADTGHRKWESVAKEASESAPIEGEATLPSEGRVVEVTMLSLEVAGVTSVSKELKPKDVVDMLNRHFGAVTNVVVGTHQGRLQFLFGDAVYAWWEADQFADHAARACSCARDLQRHASGAGRLLIAVHTGSVFVGCYGSPRRFQYGLVGSAVYFCHRLCAMARTERRAPILISGATRERVGHEFSPVYLQTVQVEGNPNPIEIYGLSI